MEFVINIGPNPTWGLPDFLELIPDKVAGQYT
jgi:hypothetical protein